MDLTITASGRRCMELGSRLGRLGVVTIGAGGEGLSRILARCAGCGAALSGSNVLFHDGSSPATGAWLARHYRLPASLYLLERDDGCALCLTDGEGRPLAADDLPPASDWAGTCGSWDTLAGTDSAYAAHAVADERVSALAVTVMDLPGQKALRCALERLGCAVLDRPRPGVALLCSDERGEALTVRDGARTLHPEGRDAVSAAVAWCIARASMPLAVPAFGDEETRLT